MDIVIEQISGEETCLSSPEEIIRSNIDKANRLLDAALDEALEKPEQTELDDILNIAPVNKLNSRRIEVIARLIDSITTAAETLITAENEGLGLLIRQDMLKLKEKELILKGERGPISIGQLTQTNLVIKTREDLLKLLEEDPTIINAEEVINDV